MDKFFKAISDVTNFILGSGATTEDIELIQYTKIDWLYGLKNRDIVKDWMDMRKTQRRKKQIKKTKYKENNRRSSQRRK